MNNDVTRTPVSYQNRYGIMLAGDLYVPSNLDATRKYPAIVIGPPYGSVNEQEPGVYANELAHRGFVVLAYALSYNGESGGNAQPT